MGYKELNLLSCLTLDIEHFHSTSHIKQSVVTMMEYCRDFGNTIKENLKRLYPSSFYYHTSSKAPWYPPPTPSSSGVLHEMPVIPVPKSRQMSNEDQDLMADWANEFGQAVRQLSNRQTTTTKKAGTLPDYMSTRKVVVRDKVVLPIRDSTSATGENTNDTNDTDDTNEGTNDAAVADVVNDEEQNDVFDDIESDPEPIFDEDLYDQRPTFLLGATTRSGRAVRMSGKLMDV